MSHTRPHPDERTQDLLAALRAAGLRLTAQRRAICQALAHDPTHPTAQALFDRLRPQFPSLSLATVYNTLNTLEQAGLIHEIGTAGDNALHYDADPTPHINLICTACHRIDDHSAEALAGLAEQVARTSGYDLRGARLAYYGLCPTCRARLAAK